MSPMSPQLVVVAGPDLGRAFPLAPEAALAIGRGAQSHTRLVDLAVSRIHCEVRLEDGRVIVTDAKSASGTFVNAQRIDSKELRPGDVIKIGNTELRYECDVAQEKTLPPTPMAKPTAAVVVTKAESVRPAPPPVAASPPRDVVFANKPGGRILPKPLKDLHELAGKSLGSFQLLSVVGTGQVGVVFQARDTKDLKVVALKVLRPDFARDAKAVQRFVRGMKTARSLRHPHLIELFNAGITGPHPWISMEFVEGESVAHLIQQAGAGPRDWKQALRVALDIGAALQFVHERGILHRNILPQNIMIQKHDGAAKLGDVILAKALEGTAAEEVTSSGEFVGNIYYMAPERTVPQAEVDGRADLYSLGVTVYSLLTGRMPFEGTSMPDVVAKIRQVAPEKPRKLQPAIPGALEAIVLRMLAKRPDDRYPTAKELLADLARVATI